MNRPKTAYNYNLRKAILENYYCISDFCEKNGIKKGGLSPYLSLKGCAPIYLLTRKVAEGLGITAEEAYKLLTAEWGE